MSAGRDCFPGAAQAHAMQKSEELLPSPVCSKAGIPDSLSHLTGFVGPSSSFSDGFLAVPEQRLHTASSVAGTGKGRTGKSPQVLLFKLHHSANNF